MRACTSAGARALTDWESAFKNADPRWRGADANYSVALGPGRTLWLFGDTWITAPDAKGREGGRLVRNTAAIQSYAEGKPGRIEFFWRTDPSSEAPGHAAPAFQPTSGPTAAWTTGSQRRPTSNDEPLKKLARPLGAPSQTH